MAKLKSLIPFFSRSCRATFTPPVDEKYNIAGPDYDISQDLVIPEDDIALESAWGTFAHRGASYTRESYFGDLARLLEKVPTLRLRLHNSLAFHGSSSPSLLFLRFPEQGLLPTGRLLKLGRVPFGGYNDHGLMASGLNHTYLSAVYTPFLPLALWFSKRTESWTPEIGKKQIADDLEGLNQCKRRCWDSEMFRARIYLNVRRSNQWKSLSVQEQNWIAHPFPILYGVRLAHRRYQVVGEVVHELEIDLKDGVRGSEINVMFVPAEKIPEVRALLDSHSLNRIYLEPLEAAGEGTPP